MFAIKEFQPYFKISCNFFCNFANATSPIIRKKFERLTKNLAIFNENPLAEVVTHLYCDKISSGHHLDAIMPYVRQLRSDPYLPSPVEAHRKRHLLQHICSTLPTLPTAASLEEAVETLAKSVFAKNTSFICEDARTTDIKGKSEDRVFFLKRGEGSLAYVVKAFKHPRNSASLFLAEVSALDLLKQQAPYGVTPIVPIALAIFKEHESEWGLLLQSAAPGQRLDRSIFALSALKSTARDAAFHTAEKAIACAGRSLAQLHAKKSPTPTTIPALLIREYHERLLRILHDRHIVEQLANYCSISDFIAYVQKIYKEALTVPVFYSHFHGDAHIGNMFYDKANEDFAFIDVAIMHRGANIQADPQFDGTIDLLRLSESLHKETLHFLSPDERGRLQNALFQAYASVNGGQLPDERLRLFYLTDIKLGRLLINSRYFEKSDPLEIEREKAIYMDAINYFKNVITKME